MAIIQQTVRHDYLIRWAEVEGLWRRQAVVPICVSAAFASYVGQWRRSLPAGEALIISRFKYAAAHLGPVVLVSLVALAFGTLPAWIDASHRATVISIDWWLAVSQIAAVVAVLSVGYLIGTVGTHIIIPLATFCVMWLSGYMPYILGEFVNGVSFLAPAPFWVNFGPPVGWRDIPFVGVLRTVLFVLLAIVSTDVAARPCKIKIWQTITPLLLPGLVGFTLLAAQPKLITQDKHIVCDDDGLVCVPKDVEPALEDLSKGAHLVIDIYGLGALEYMESNPKGKIDVGVQEN
ncbi:MAG: hypothetical protein ACRC2W_01795, partial [Plesiomonas shigelloides]